MIKPTASSAPPARRLSLPPEKIPIRSTSPPSENYLRFGDVFVAATAPLHFVRPSRDAFHTFPLPKLIYPRDCAASNELRLRLSDTPGQVRCRQSLFFAVEIGSEQPALSVESGTDEWTVGTERDAFGAALIDGKWEYTLTTASGMERLPRIGFGFDPSLRDERRGLE